MKNIDAYNEFKNREEVLATELERMNKKDSKISTFRVISFLAASVLLIIGISDKVVPATVFGCLAMVVFVVLVKLHGDVVKNIEILKNLLNIVANLFSKPVSEDENETDSIFKVRVRPSSFSRCFGPVAAYTMQCASGHPVPA